MTYPSGGTYPSSPTLQGAGYRTFLEVQDQALGSDFDAGRYRDLVKTWINEALGKIARRVRLIQPLQGTYTLTTVSGEAALDLPVDDIRVLSLREPSTRTELDDVGIDAMDQAVAATGRPQAFALFGGQLTVYPTPDGEYGLELRYERDAALLSLDTDTMPLPDAYADLPVYYCRARLFEREDDFEAGAYWQSKFDAELQELRADLGRQNRSRVRQVPGMWAGQAPGPRFQRP